MNKKNKHKGDLIFGVNPILELLKSKRRKLIAIYTTKPEPKAWKSIERLFPKYPFHVQYVKREVLHKLAEATDHQGVVAWVQPFPFRKKFFDPNKQKLLIMLDGIQDTRNLGAILRSSYCTGVNGIILLKKGSAPLNAVAIKASAGLAERLEIFIAPSAQSAVQMLKDAGYNLYMATFDGEDATRCHYKSPMCLVIGSEGFGISKNILKFGTKVTLPQKSSDVSFNASVAAGLLMFLASRQIGSL